MNDNAKLWVETLRSGEFTQATNHLRTPSGYCCLGVACELYRRETGKGQWSGHTTFTTSSNDGSTTGLPLSVSEWLGLDSSDPTINHAEVPVPGDDHYGYLSRYNDNGYSFNRIADLIEEKVLFVE